MRTIKHAISIYLVTGSAAFSPNRFSFFATENLRLSRALLPSRKLHRSLAFPAIGDRHTDGPTNRINPDDVSEMERFFSGMRELYSDLENKGGAVRRQMSGVAFTYVSPVDPSANKNDENRQLSGAWRLQTPQIISEHERLYAVNHENNPESMNMESSKRPPLLLYIPGLDGFGISATAQFDDLSTSFEFWRMSIDRQKDQSFSDLVIAVVKFVKDSTGSLGPSDSPREVILVGESFGGVLALSVAMASTNNQSSSMALKGLVLVNPATSFDETSWENLVPLLTSMRHLESEDNTTQTLPTPYSILGSMALAATVPDRTQFSNIANFILQSVSSSSTEQLLSASYDGLSILTEYLSASTLNRRVLNWLPVGTAVVNNEQRLSKLNVPTLAIGGTGDNMLPTKNEVNRLGKLLPDCVKMEVAGAGHFVLDTRMNLTEIILDSHIFPPQSEYDPIVDWTLPPDHVVKTVIDRIVVPQRERTSPVFFSTDPETGKRRRGLSHVPARKKPLLIVGNHQLFGQDLGMIISELLEERGIVPRGLAHPIALGGFTNTAGSNEPRVREQKRRWEFDENSQSMAAPTALFSMFGAVKVSPRNFYRLLQTNQTVLLFPGGTKEALHGKDEAYQLFWPEKVDFVRVAAKFNATIVPLSAIGAADSVEFVLDAPDLLKLPFGIGDNLANFTASAPSARFDAANEDELFVPPLALPKPFPARHYFLFGKPFDTTLVDAKDQDSCLRAYNAIKAEVEHDMQALLNARKHDAYAFDGVKRSSYQRFFGKAPPTFPLESLLPSSRKAIY